MLLFHPERCTRAWLRESTCDLCVSACPVKALNLQNGRVVVDSSKCIVCGVCVAACPLQAFDVGVGYRQILQRIAGRKEVLLSCRNLGEGEVRIPCLGFLDKALLYALAAEGVELQLDVTSCESCPARSGMERFIQALNEVQAQLKQKNRSLVVRMVRLRPEIPPGVSQQSLGGSRGEEKPSMTRPRRQIPEKVTLRAEVLRSIWFNLDDRVPWQHPHFYGERCNLCGVCAGVCPTGALIMEEGLGTLQIRLSDCASCRTCIEACDTGALIQDTTAPAGWLSEEVILGSIPVRFCRRCSRHYPAHEEVCPYCNRLIDMIRAFHTEAGQRGVLNSNGR
jgi:ferredoxin